MAALERGCELGGARACLELAAVLGAPASDAAQHTRAAQIFERLCGEGLALGCREAGRAREDGSVVARDLVAARSFYQKACVGEDLSSCTRVGFMMARGLGGPAEPNKAAAVLRVSCESAEVSSCTTLGQLASIKSEGAQEALDRAQRALTERCDVQQGADSPAEGQRSSLVAASCEALGVLWKRGMGTKRDLARARSLFDRACQAGRPSACARAERLQAAAP